MCRKINEPKVEKNFLYINSKVLNRKQQLKWPVLKINLKPIMNNGSSLRKPINLPLKEFEWNTLENHTKKIGVGKTEWIRYAIYRILVEEQEYYYKDVNKNE